MATAALVAGGSATGGGVVAAFLARRFPGIARRIRRRRDVPAGP
jgi:hypothetical protein